VDTFTLTIKKSPNHWNTSGWRDVCGERAGAELAQQLVGHCKKELPAGIPELELILLQ